MLFEGRGAQLQGLRHQLLEALLLSTDETVGEALLRMQVPVE
ncbi:hypothetical protein [Pseudomonas xanthosomatis]|nr:hypothetical protein [Pseudomonas xanthosomatis]